MEAGQMKIKMPVKLKAQLMASAKANRRSMNSEVIRALEHYFGSGAPDADQAHGAARVDDGIERRVEVLEASVKLLSRMVIPADLRDGD